MYYYGHASKINYEQEADVRFLQIYARAINFIVLVAHAPQYIYHTTRGHLRSETVLFR